MTSLTTPAAEIKTTSRERTLARRAAGLAAHDSRPVCVLPGGRMAPRELGRSYYWTTPSGKTVVRHPNAYGWPTLYHGSTRRICVGELWLREHAARG